VINLIELCKYRLYACCYCNTKSRTVAFYDYYDTPLAPYCIDCFVYVMNELLNKYNKAIQNIKLPEDKIEEIEKMNHTSTEARIAYAKHILDDNRDEKY
jgi:hypothetical protein